MKYGELLASYLPSVIVKELLNESTEELPRRTDYEACVLFADISGFTNLSERMCTVHGGHQGSEYLATKLNSIFAQVVKIISSQGGDVLKFAGDAMIVLWPPSEDENLVSRTRRAAQCAVHIQELLRTANHTRAPSEAAATSNELSMKIGLGVGALAILQVGGLNGRREHVAVGEPLVQAFAAESFAQSGDIILSPNVFFLIEEFFKASKVQASSKNKPFYLLNMDYKGEALRKKNKFAETANMFGSSYSSEHERRIRSMIPAAALQSIDALHPEFENFSSELRRVSVLFISLGLTEHDLTAAAKNDKEMLRIHFALEIAQRTLYKFEGAVNKFLMDDKGATIIAVFGLPPFSHENDPKRAVLCALELVGKLESQLDLQSNIGCTTGTAFCGVLGSQTRKEYSVLGDTVNLAARFMQASKKAAPCTIYCGASTYQASKRDVAFDLVGYLKVKGKSQPVQTFKPLSTQEAHVVPLNATLVQPHNPHSNANGSPRNTVCGESSKTGRSSQQGHAILFSTRYTKITLIASERVQGLVESRTEQVRNDSLRLYFRGVGGGSGRAFGSHGRNSEANRKVSKLGTVNPMSMSESQLSGGSATPTKRLRNSKTKLSKAPSSMFRAVFRAKPKTGSTNPEKREVGSNSIVSTSTTSSMGSPKHRSMPGSEFEFEIPASSSASSSSSSSKQQKTSNLRVGTRASRKSSRKSSMEEESKSGGSTNNSKGVLHIPAPSRIGKRESLILYNSTSAGKALSKEKILAYQAVFMQAAVGANTLLYLGHIQRDAVDHVMDIFATALHIAKDASLLRPGVSSHQVSLLIQGTEFVVPPRLFLSNSEFLQRRRADPKANGGSGILPIKYIEAIVTEALANGEIRQEASPRSRSSGGKKSTHAPLSNGTPRKFWKSKARASRNSSLTGVDLLPFTDNSGNGGTDLKLVLIRNEDVSEIQSSSSMIMQTLMQRKIELIENEKGSVVMITGDPGSGKTRMLKRFTIGFLNSMVLTLSSADRWSQEDEGEFDTIDQRQAAAQGVSFHVWLDALSQWLERETRSGGSAKPGRQTNYAHAQMSKRKEMQGFRSALIRGILNKEYHKDASLLNKSLGTNFPVNPERKQSLGSDKELVNYVNETMRKLIVDMVSTIAIKCNGLLLVFDDALRLDEQSWWIAKDLAGYIAKDDVPLMLVMSSRPFEGIVDRSLGLSPSLIPPSTRDALKAYRALCSMPIVENVHLGPMSTYTAMDLFRKSIGDNVHAISPELWDVCESRCYNNPLLIKEFSFELKNARRPKIVKYTRMVDSPNSSTTTIKRPHRRGRHSATPRLLASLRVAVQDLDEPAWTVHAAHKAASSKRQAFLVEHEGQASRVLDSVDEEDLERHKFSVDFYPPSEIPPPATAAGILGARIDRLPPMEQLVLKIACVVGSIFSLRLVENVYPYSNDETRAEVKSACEALADQHGVLHKIRANAYNDEYVYQCADVLLVATVRHRLLLKQKLSLAARISRARSQYKAALNLSDMSRQDKNLSMSLFRGTNRSASSASSSKKPWHKQDLLLVRKKDAKVMFSGWKERYVILTEDSIMICKKRVDREKFTDSDAQETINLNEAKVSELDLNPSDTQVKWGFVVESAEWAKKNEHHFSTRSFTFAGCDVAVGAQWLSRVRMVTNKLTLGALLPMRSKVRSTRSTRSVGISKRLLPVRRRTDHENQMRSSLQDGESVISLTIEKMKLSDNCLYKAFEDPTSTQEIYASLCLSTKSTSQLVRKETTISVLEEHNMVEFRETFLLVVSAESLFDWENLAKQIEGPTVVSNAEVQIIVWRQQNSALGFDEMIGIATLSLPKILSMLESNRTKTAMQSMSLDLSWPYNPKFGEPEDILESSSVVLKVDLQLSGEDQARLEKIRRKPDFSQTLHSGADLFKLNKALALRHEQFTLEHSPAARESNITAVSESTGSRVLDGHISTLKKQRSASDAHTKVNRKKWPMVPEPKRNSTPHSLEIGGSEGAASDAVLTHLEFLVQTVDERDDIKQLQNLKAFLLAQRYRSLVKDIALDETTKLFISSFNQVPSETDALGKSKSRKSTNRKSSSRSRTSTLESHAEEYKDAIALELNYLHNNTDIRGPCPLSFFTNKLIKQQISDDLLVYVCEVDDDMRVSTKRIKREAMIPLRDHLESLEKLARAAAKAATSFKQTSMRKSALTKALLKDNSTLVTVSLDSHRPVTFESYQLVTLEALDKTFSAWCEAKVVEDRNSVDPASWRFDIGLVPVEASGAFVACCFRRLGLESRVDKRGFRGFMESVYEAMTQHCAAYHTYEHALDVFQAVFSILGQMKGEAFFSEIELLALLTAALGHDLYHPGQSNRYQKLIKSELAIKYSQSPLESFHAASLLNLLRKEETNLLGKLEGVETDLVRKIIVETVLATDMSGHFNLTEELRTVAIRNTDAPGELTGDDRLVIAKVIVHCADLSNPTRTWEVSHRWQCRIMDEFFAQGDLERTNGFEISPGMDRYTTHMEDLAVSFIDFIVAPLYVGLASLLPSTGEICLQLASNRAKWAEIQREKVSRLDEDHREEALRNLHARNQAFDKILANAGFDRKENGTLSFSLKDESTHRRNSLFALEAYPSTSSRASFS